MKDAAAKSDARVAPEGVNSSPVSPSTYERDYYAWVQEQVKALRERRTEALDWENLREEVEDLGKGVRLQLRSRLKIVLAHLLKWQFQPSKRSVSWKATLVEQRGEIAEILQENPSLKSQLPELLANSYELARRLAGTEMRMEKREWQQALPSKCPWSVDQLLDEDFVPTPARVGSRSR